MASSEFVTFVSRHNQLVRQPRGEVITVRIGEEFQAETLEEQNNIRASGRAYDMSDEKQAAKARQLQADNAVSAAAEEEAKNAKQAVKDEDEATFAFAVSFRMSKSGRRIVELLIALLGATL